MRVKSFVFSGNHYEMGFQQGQTFRELIQRGFRELLDSKLVKKNKPRLLPKSLFAALAKRRADKLLRSDIFGYYPKQAERLRGVADGAAVSVSTILFVQMLEMLFGSCTTIGFSPELTSIGETIIAKNFDYLNSSEPYNLTCETKPNEGYKTLGCKMMPLPGILDGMNEHGLTVTYNLARSADKPKFFAPTSIMLQEMLETCKDAEEAVGFLIQAKRGGHDAVLTLADSEESVRTVEISSNHASVRELENGRVINTNHYQTAEMQSIEIPYSESSELPEYFSSPYRFRRVEELLKDIVNVDERLLVTVLRDHGADNTPSKLTICRHEEETGTLRSLIFYPKKRIMKVLYGHPCRYKYRKIKFI